MGRTDEEDKFKEENNMIILEENKGDIKGLKEVVISTATKEDILNNVIYSLNGKDYNTTKMNIGEDYKLVKLGDICEFMPKSKRKASYGKTTGNYNFYTSSNTKILKCDVADYNEECLIIGSGGVANIKIDNQFSCSGDNFILKSSINQYYLYHIFNGYTDLLSNGFNGSTIKHLSKQYLTNLEIPVPKTEEKLKYWVDKISKPYQQRQTNQTKIYTLELEIKNKIQYITENEECEEVELGSVCTFKSGKYNTCNMDNKGNYPFYNATIKSIGFHSEYCFDDDKYLLLIKSGNVKAEGLGSVIKLKGKTACVSDTVQIKSIINIDYLYYVMCLIKDRIRKTSTNSVGLGHLKISEIKLIKIKLPKNKQLITDLEPTFKEIETLKEDLSKQEELYKQYLKELKEEAIPERQTINDNNPEDNQQPLEQNQEINNNPPEEINEIPINQNIIQEMVNEELDKKIVKKKRKIKMKVVEKEQET